MRRIIIEAVGQSEMRPPYNRQAEGGDWYVDEAGDLRIKVIGADVEYPAAFLIALHETVEAILCRREGVPQEAVDAFDMAYRGDDEPGDQRAAPYRSQHRRAMLVEHLMASFMGLDDYGVVE